MNSILFSKKLNNKRINPTQALIYQNSVPLFSRNTPSALQGSPSRDGRKQTNRYPKVAATCRWLQRYRQSPHRAPHLYWRSPILPLRFPELRKNRRKSVPNASNRSPAKSNSALSKRARYIIHCAQLRHLTDEAGSNHIPTIAKETAPTKWLRNLPARWSPSIGVPTQHGVFLFENTYPQGLLFQPVLLHRKYRMFERTHVKGMEGFRKRKG